jgi:hypothetical protein
MTEPTAAIIEAGLDAYYTPPGRPLGWDLRSPDDIRAMVEALWRAMAAAASAPSPASAPPPGRPAPPRR